MLIHPDIHLEIARQRHEQLLAEAERRRVAIKTDPRSVVALRETGATGLEPATSGVTGRRSNQLNYAPEGDPV
jgi:hypothetical protein